MKVAQKARGGVKRPLVKWVEKDTLKYRVFGKLSFVSQKEWNKFMNEVAMLTGISILESKDNDSDIVVYFGRLNKYSKLVNANIPAQAYVNFNYWSNRRINRANEITAASICIDPLKTPVLNEGVFRLKREFLKILGIVGEIDDQYSIFSKDGFTGYKNVSRKDKRFIKLHYQDAIQPGLSEYSLRGAIETIPTIDEFAVEKL